MQRIHWQLLDRAALATGHRVLEIGCGTGNLALLAKATQPEAVVVGLDPDIGALARARRKARRRGLEIQLDRGYADQLPYADDSVDVVLSAFMLHHLPEAERGQAAADVRRVLRPGGRLHVVDVGGHASDADGRATRRARDDARLRDNFGDGIPELLRRAGFSDVAETASVVRPLVGRLTFVSAGA